jgi:hypothetical protein
MASEHLTGTGVHFELVKGLPVTLEFDKVVTQIEKMGRSLYRAEQTAQERLDSIWNRFLEIGDYDSIWRKILLAREHDAGFRGAGPFEGEPINYAYPLPPCPERATVLAADGSQVYPDPHGPTIYYLTNIAVFIYHHGEPGALPEPVTEPGLFFDQHETHDREGRIIANAAVNARRSIFEMQMLVRETVSRVSLAPLTLSLYDGPLLFWLGKEVPRAQELMEDYHEAVNILLDMDVRLVGYVDQPRSRFLLNTLYLMHLADDEVTRAALMTVGDMEGLDDRFLMRYLLQPGDRSALMIQQSPQNKAFKDLDESREIAFFYINLASEGQDPYLARVEVPMWVAKSRQAVDEVHALLYEQCQILDRYPYVLTRADECAVIRGHEKEALQQMIAIELIKNQLSVAGSQKLEMKGVSRYGRRQHTGL